MGSVTATGYTGTYDGAAHGITVNAPAGATVKYGTAATALYTLDASPTYTNAGTYTVYYQVTRANMAMPLQAVRRSLFLRLQAPSALQRPASLATKPQTPLSLRWMQPLVR